MFRHPHPKCEALQQVFRHLYPKCGALMIRRDLGPSVFLRGNKEMTVRFDNLGFYNVDTRYLQYLNTIEPEVQFTQEKDYTQKPFLGILVIIETYTYFIPLTSGKPKHAKWKNVGSAHYLIYEQVPKAELRKRDIYKSISETDALQIFAALGLQSWKIRNMRIYLKRNTDFARKYRTVFFLKSPRFTGNRKKRERFILCTVTFQDWKMPAISIGPHDFCRKRFASGFLNAFFWIEQKAYKGN